MVRINCYCILICANISKPIVVIYNISWQGVMYEERGEEGDTCNNMNRMLKLRRLDVTITQPSNV